jgi:tripartite-type tricarboxylate transporter receptor subunit TctC
MKNEHRRDFLKLSAGLAAGAATSTLFAQDRTSQFPTKPVRLVLPFPPGALTDAFARLLAVRLQEAWKQPVIIEHKPGAGTIIGTEAIARSAPDGHTIGMVVTAHAINPSIYKSLPYDTLRDLSGVTQLSVLHMIVAARPDLEANTPAELIALAKRSPGRITIGGAEGVPHLGGERLNLMAGIQLVHVPYKGSAAAQNELLGGRIDLAVVSLSPSLMQQAKAGRLKIIGAMNAKRTPLAPEIAAFGETVPGFEAAGMYGLIVRGGTPRELVQRLYADVAAVVRTPEINERMRELGMDPVASTPEEFDAFVRRQMAIWAPVVKAAGVAVN